MHCVTFCSLQLYQPRICVEQTEANGSALKSCDTASVQLQSSHSVHNIVVQHFNQCRALGLVNSHHGQEAALLVTGQTTAAPGRQDQLGSVDRVL